MAEEITPPRIEPLSSEPVEDPDAPADPGSRAGAAGAPDLQALIVSVEELRALLAPLGDQERRQVLELARRLRHPDRPAT